MDGVESSSLNRHISISNPPEIKKEGPAMEAAARLRASLKHGNSSDADAEVGVDPAYNAVDRGSGGVVARTVRRCAAMFTPLEGDMGVFQLTLGVAPLPSVYAVEPVDAIRSMGANETLPMGTVTSQTMLLLSGDDEEADEKKRAKKRF